MIYTLSMSMPILTTKLYIPPPRPNLVLRSRLIERLYNGLHRKLTLIAAPAGFGKTTLVSEWIATSDRPTAWLSLDEADSELTHFLTYLISALQTAVLSGTEGVALTIGDGVLAMLQSPQPPPTNSLLTALLNELATIPINLNLVLDDYHLLDAIAIDEALTFLLDHLPPQVHLVITTREDPNLPLARYRVRGQLTEVRAADLRFTPDEAAQFLNQSMGLALSTEEIAALETRTEGWIAGLQMAALSIQGRLDTAHFIQAFTGSHHFVLDYLAEEVLQRQPERVRIFLLQTSILDRLCGALCDAVTGRNDGRQMLETLDRTNLFVVPLDEQRQWYRYHRLFTEVLQAHLMERQPEEILILHRRASEWYEENGLRADAIRHALAAEDFAWAAALIELSWRTMDRRFQFAAWLGWARALPEELIRTMPVLSVGVAWALLDGGELEASEIYLRNAERWLNVATAPTNPAADPPTAAASDMVVVDEEEFDNLPATIATAHAYRAQAIGDFSGSIAYTQRALELIPEDDILRRVPAMGLLGIAQWANGDLEVAYHTFDNFRATMQAVGHIVFAISAVYGAANIRLAQGRLRAARRIYEQALALVMTNTPGDGLSETVLDKPVILGTADLYLGLSDLAHEQGDLAAARDYLHRSEALGAQAALPDWPHRICLTQARMEAAQGDLDSTINLLDEAARRYYRSPMPAIRPIAAFKTQIWVKQGRLTEALEWVNARALSVEDDLSYLREYEHITLARVLLAQYRHSQEKNVGGDDFLRDALKLLARLLPLAKAGGRIRSVLEILVQQVLAYQARGDIAAALDALKNALALAEPEGYVRLFVDEGKPIDELLTVAAMRGILPDYVNKLRAAIESGQEENDDSSWSQLSVSSTSPGHFPNRSSEQPLIEPLSQREMEVLQLVAEGLSNREISERLFLSVNTVKGHNRIIFGKLQVQRRTEAVARARELGLV